MQYRSTSNTVVRSSAGVTWCNGQRITRLPLLGAPAVTSCRRRTTHWGHSSSVEHPVVGRKDAGSEPAGLAHQIDRLPSARTRCRLTSRRRCRERSALRRSIRHTHVPTFITPHEFVVDPRIRKSRSSVGRASESPSPCTLSLTGPKDGGLSNHEAASSNLAGSSTPFSARMGIGRAPPGTVAQQRTTEHGVAAPGPIARRGPDGAGHRRRDAGATPAGPGTIRNTM